MSNMSFLPEDYLEKRIQRRTNQICLTLFVVVMAAVVGAYMVTDRQRREVRRQQQAVHTNFTEAAKRLEQLDELQRRKADMIRKARVTSNLLERIPRTMVLSELINNMPAAMSVLELELESKVTRAAVVQTTSALAAARKQGGLPTVDNATPDDAPKTRVTLKLVGVAPTDVEVAQFMHNLGRCEMFRDVNLLFSEQVTVDKQTLRKFRIEMVLNQGLDIYHHELRLVRRNLKQNPMGESLKIMAEDLLDPSVPTADSPVTTVSDRQP